MEASKELRSAFIALQCEMTPVVKDGANPHFGSNFATLKAIVEMLRPLCVKYRIGYVQSVEDGVDAAHAVMVTRIFHAEADGELASRFPFACGDLRAQALGSAGTYAKRYGLQCAFGVVVCDDADDDDGERAQVAATPKSSKTAPRVSATAAKVDAWVCPCGSVKGKRWTEIDVETLRKIAAFPAEKVPALTEAHRVALKSEIGKREASAK